MRQLDRLVGAVCEHVAYRRVAAGDAAPVTVVADAREIERIGANAQRYVTIEELFGAPRYGSLPDAVRDAVSREWERVLALHPADPEAAAARIWIDVVEDLPWSRPMIGPRPEPAELRRQLDNAYVGHDEEKEQVLDHLAARGLTRQAARSPDVPEEGEEPGGADGAATATVLCFWGPPGVGRTAFAAAVAAALGRRCVCVPLAGARDAAAVRGVARSGREPAPGRIVTALRQSGEPPERKGSDPLCVLGGIDRMNDAAADALLDVLDPVRNRAFRDHYVGLPLDLSEVTFVATATDPEAIPMPLLERLELARGAQSQFLHQDVGGGGHQDPQLVGPEAAAAGAVYLQTVEQFLDAVLDVAAGAIDLLVDVAGGVAKIGDDEARVVARLTVVEADDFGLDDDTPGVAPGGGGIARFGVDVCSPSGPGALGARMVQGRFGVPSQDGTGIHRLRACRECPARPAWRSPARESRGPARRCALPNTPRRASLRRP